MNREARVTAGCMLLLLIGFVIGFGHAPALRANNSNITQTDVLTLVTAQAISPSGTFTSRPFTALQKTVNQSAQFRGVGTSPNYKVELLTTLDGTNFVKPEVGGDLGTFTDGNWHVVSIGGPLAVADELKFTELGGANTVTTDALEASQ